MPLPEQVYYFMMMRCIYVYPLSCSGGSDTYTNQRAFNYGKRMEKRHDVMPPDQPNPDHPITESALFFHEFICKTQVLVLCLDPLF